jgi:mevalonate kinase
MSDGHRCNIAFRTRGFISSKRFCEAHETTIGKTNRRRNDASIIEKSKFLDKIMPLWDGYEKKLKKLVKENKKLKKKIANIYEMIEGEALMDFFVNTKRGVAQWKAYKEKMYQDYEKKLGRMGVDIENMEITIDSDGVEKLQNQLTTLHSRLRKLEGEEE